MPEIIRLAAGALHHLTEMVPGLEIDAPQMTKNLDLTHGLIFAEAVQMALGSTLGRMAAHELVEAACQRAKTEKRHLREVLTEYAKVEKYLTKKDFDRLFDPREYFGVAERLIDRVLASTSSHRPKAAGWKE